MKLYENADADASVLEGKRLVVAGYGNQGRPQALNLRDSGFEVAIAGRPGGTGHERGRADGFECFDLAEGVRIADVLLFLLPDEVQIDVFRDTVAGRLSPGSAICFAHGFTPAFCGIQGEYDIIMVAPKGQGERLRTTYLEGSGLPCLIGVEQDRTGRALSIALAIAQGLGCLRVGGFETTAREEAVSDLFGEQAVLCGGVPALVKAAFDLLVRRGYSPEVAYFECMHELKIIVDLMVQRGFSGMRDVISGTAAYGSLRFGERIITPECVEEMERLFDRIDRGDFAREWLSAAGGGALDRLSEKERTLLIEEVGERIRKMFPK